MTDSQYCLQYLWSPDSEIVSYVSSVQNVQEKAIHKQGTWKSLFSHIYIKGFSFDKGVSFDANPLYIESLRKKRERVTTGVP